MVALFLIVVSTLIGSAVGYGYVLIVIGALLFLVISFSRPTILLFVAALVLSANQTIIFSAIGLSTLRWVALGMCALPIIHKVVTGRQLRKNIYTRFTILLIHCLGTGFYTLLDCIKV